MVSKATKLLVCADAGGSNGHRVRAWKVELAKLAADTGLDITVCHFPPGTSKWNQIEHRMFSYITMNWRGRPLVSYRVIISLIANTTTKKGLKINADLDQGYYPTGVKITNKQLAAVPLSRHDFHGDWNYTVHPSTSLLLHLPRLDAGHNCREVTPAADRPDSDAWVALRRRRAGPSAT